MALETFPWNVQDNLKTAEDQLGYLEAAFEEGDPAFIAIAIQDVAEAKGMEIPSTLTAQTGLGDYMHVLKALGFELTAKAA